jgi:N-methylhydantoinase B
MRAGGPDGLDPSFARLIRCASRMPDIVLGDLDTQIAAGRAAQGGLRRIASEMGAAGFLAATDDLLDRSEGELAARLADLTGGPWQGADALDPVADLGPCMAQVALSIRDRTLVADFSGSSPQVQAPVNCVRSGPLSAVFYGVLTLLGPATLRNGGLLRRIALHLPEASVVNAAPPAAVNARMNMVRCITSAVLQALAEADPERRPAANSGMSFVIAFSGRREDGARFLSTEIVAGGAGGGPNADGAAAISTDVGNAMNLSAEALEAAIPVRLISAERRHGSGGAGRYRGGDGVRRIYEALQDGIAVSVRGERFSRVARGMRGGGSPQGSAARILRKDGTTVVLSARSAIVLNCGDRLVIESSGGAGYGAPP